jgi:hypothetical protein
VRSIVGGSVATTCQWPTTIIVLPIECTGTLVHSRAIVTAKHCLVDHNGSPTPQTAIALGESESQPARTVAIAKCYTHPSNDFGICTLARDVLDVPIVPVMAPCEMSELKEGAPVVEAGFGAATGDNNAVYGTKKWIAGKLAASATTSVDIQATAGSQDGEYYGDSGGPLYLHMPDTTWRLIGEDCCSPDIISGSRAPRISTYTSVPYHVAWAEKQTGLDLTPCHDGKGWVGGATCTGFPTDPDRSGGTWATSCQGQNLLLTPTCASSPWDASAGEEDATPGEVSAGTSDAPLDTSIADAHWFEAPGDTEDASEEAGAVGAGGHGGGMGGAGGAGGEPGVPDDASSTPDTGGVDATGETGAATASGGFAASGGRGGGAGAVGGSSSTGGNVASAGGHTAGAGATTGDTGGASAKAGSAGSGGRPGSTSTAPTASSGCSCRLAAPSSSGARPGGFAVFAVFNLLGLLGLLGLLARRRRRKG